MSGGENDDDPSEAEEAITAREIAEMDINEYLELPPEELRELVSIHLNETHKILDRYQDPNPGKLLTLSRVLEK